MTRTRSIFRFASTEGLIDKPLQFGAAFRVPSAKVLLQARYARGPMMFEANEIRRLISAADPHMTAMILLGTNCGFGPHDISSLPTAGVNTKAGWCIHP